MIIACPACSTRYVVPDSAIGIEGRTVRCAKCRHSWFQDSNEIVTEPPVARPEPVPASEPVPQRAGTAAPPAAAAPPPPAPAPSPVNDTLPPDVDEEADSAVADEDTAIAEPVATPSFDTHPEAPPLQPPAASPAKATYYDDDENGYYSDEARSSFEFEPPFKPRRNPAKMWMLAAVLFAVVALAAAAAVWRYGLPDWAPAGVQTFAEAQPDLILDFPANRQDRRTLPNGTEYFGASGTITNVGQSRRTVPTVLIVMRDDRDRIVYSWEVVPPKRQLSPGESVNINEAVTDVPKSATAAEIGWKPG